MNDEPPAAVLELQAWPHWVVWRTEERDGKPTKVPYDPHTGRRASSTDEETWAKYEVAAKALARGKYDGLGYVFSPGDEYLGIDLDDCVDVKPLGTAILPWAWEIIQRFSSYTEYSPTGTGVHIYIRAAVKGSRRRTGSIEFYDQARFFTFTGRQVFGMPGTIEARQDEFDALYDELFPPAPKPPTNGRRPRVPVPDSDQDLLERIRKSKQGPAFEKLWAGQCGESQSEADLGLMNMLAFWTGGDEQRMDSLFRQSGLMRDKYDEARGERTYGQMTIDKALEGRTAFYNPGGGASAGNEPKARPADDDVARAPAEDISANLGLIDDPIVSGWRSSRQAKARVVLTTRSGAVLELENWKAATGSPKTLAQEVRMQLGVDVTLKQENLNRLDVLIGKFCELVETTTVEQRARQLCLEFLAEAEIEPVDMADQKSRHDAFCKLQNRHPATRSKAEGITLAAASIVLVDASGKRYVRTRWFIDYVKAAATSSTVSTILEMVEAPGWWTKPNSQARIKATDPKSGKPVYLFAYEVPAGWSD